MAISKKTAIALVGAAIASVGLGGTYLAANAQGGWGDHAWGHGKERLGKGRHMRHMMAKADANKDGEITREEVKVITDERFAQYDASGDGLIEAREVEQVIRARMEKRLQRMVKGISRRFDADRDGKVTKDEFSRFAFERFTWADSNDDGKISGEEIPRRMKHWKQRHRDRENSREQE